MSKYSLLLRILLTVLSMLAVTPLTAVASDAAIDAAIKSISQDRLKSYLKNNSLKDGGNYLPDSQPDIASSNVAGPKPDGGRAPLLNIGDCPAPWGDLSMIALAVVAGAATNHYGDWTTASTAAPSQPCIKSNMIGRN